MESTSFSSDDNFDFTNPPTACAFYIQEAKNHPDITGWCLGVGVLNEVLRQEMVWQLASGKKPEDYIGWTGTGAANNIAADKWQITNISWNFDAV